MKLISKCFSVYRANEDQMSRKHTVKPAMVAYISNPRLRRLRWKDFEFEASLVYSQIFLCQKEKEKNVALLIRYYEILKPDRPKINQTMTV